MSSDRIAIIMRGCPGSGKSTYLRNHYPQAVVCSADHYFEQKDGSYRFNPKLLGKAHGQCKYRFRRALEEGVNLVAVDNTNRRVWEMQEYVNLANQHGYDILVIRLDVDPDVAIDRGIHNVPADKVREMASTFEDLPEGWIETVVKL